MLIFDVFAEVAAEAQGSHPTISTIIGLSDDVHIPDIFEKEAFSYDGSTGEEQAVLSYDEDDWWGSIVETHLKPDKSKFSQLSIEDLKAIDNLQSETPSREVQGSTVLLFILVAKYTLS